MQWPGKARIWGWFRARHPRWAGPLRLIAVLARRSFREFLEDHCQQMAAAISYHLLFSIFPLFIMAVGVIGLITQDPHSRDVVATAVLKVVPLSGKGAKQLSSMLTNIGGAAGALGAIGIVGLLWSASGVMAALRTGLNMAWDTDTQRPFVRGKIVDLLMIAFAFVVIAATLGATLLVSLVRQHAGSLPGPLRDLAPVIGAVASVATFFVAAAMLFATFLALYRFVPAVATRVRDIWPGALVAAVGFELAQQAFAVYVAHSSHYEQVYGVLSSIVAFLFFVYIASAILLFGAEVASEYPRMRAGAPPGGTVSGSGHHDAPYAGRRRPERTEPGESRPNRQTAPPS